MPDIKDLFSHFATILPVMDVVRSIAFYQDQLGFEVTFTWNDPVDYAVVKRGGVGIHLTKRQDNLSPSEVHTTMYVFVHNVDTVYNDFQSRGVNIKNPLGDREYGMRDFDIKDPDGYIISFGKGIN